MNTPHMPDLIALRTQLDAYKVPRCADLDAAVTASEHVQAAMTASPGLPDRVSDLDPDQIVDLVTRLATSMDEANRGQAGNRLHAKLQQEAADALRDHVPAIVKALSPAFAKAVEVVNAAAAAGIRPNMTAEQIIDLDSADAVAAYRPLNDAFGTLSDIARIRVRLSQMLGLAPQVSPAQAAIGERVDFTACFVDQSTGLTSGYSETGSVWRWLSLSIAAGGKLTLNDEATVRRILELDGDSPGWVVCGGSAVVTDDGGRQLMLYTNDWIPTWVDDEQVDTLVDGGFVVAARPEAKRPADMYPLGAEGATKAGAR